MDWTQKIPRKRKGSRKEEPIKTKSDEWLKKKKDYQRKSDGRQRKKKARKPQLKDRNAFGWSSSVAFHFNLHSESRI